jgi:hypothetical protein
VKGTAKPNLTPAREECNKYDFNYYTLVSIIMIGPCGLFVICSLSHIIWSFMSGVAKKKESKKITKLGCEEK